MKRTLAAALIATAALFTGACSDEPPDVTGDSNTENQQTEAPAPVPS